MTLYRSVTKGQTLVESIVHAAVWIESRSTKLTKTSWSKASFILSSSVKEGAFPAAPIIFK